MRNSYERQVAEQIEIRGRILRGEDKIVPTPLFADVCRLIWPEKTAANLAAIADRDERTAKRWLAGEFEPPIVVALYVFGRIFGRC